MNYLYTICIGPVEYILSIISYLLFDVFHSESIVIICFAIFVNTVTSPLYKAAEEKSRIQRERKKEISFWEKSIKGAFDGDERLARLSTYYKEKNYNVVFSTIQEILPLLLQIPFFMAAYNFILGSGLLDNGSFYALEDLNSPDGLLRFKEMEINILPILMTAINVISSLIYLRGKSVREYFQNFTLTIFFLIVLYKSPSGLVLYWLTNNIYSLFRNLINRCVSDNRRILLFLSLVPVAVYFIWEFVLVENKNWIVSHNGIFFILIAAPVFCIYRDFIRGHLPLRFAISDKILYTEERRSLLKNIMMLMLFLVLLLGGIIPVDVVSSSPVDFIHFYNFHDPLIFIYGNLCVYLGIALWIMVFSWVMLDDKGINYLYVIMLVFSMFAVFQYLFFGKNYGVISEELVYDSLIVQNREKAVSGLILIVVVCICILTQKYRKFWNIILCGAVIAALAFLLVKGNSVRHTINRMYDISIESGSDSAETEKIYKLSKDDKNVVVIMLDRAIGAMLPYVMKEKPILREQFAGFTYYPDTLSFGARTNRAAAALFGGYEYSTELTNERKDESVKEKFSESLNILPQLFWSNGYEVTVADLPYLNEEGLPSLDSFNSNEGMRGYILEGRYNYLFSEDYQNEKNEIVQRRFYMYSVLRTAPSFCVDLIYSNGDYMLYHSDNSINESFLDAYMVLDVLPEITETEHDIPGQFIMFTNNATHEPCYLQMPEYEPQKSVDNSAFEGAVDTVIEGRKMGFETLIQKQSFEVTVAAMTKLGEYFDYLRECGVYDNTRIIVVSDHGEPIAQFEDMIYMDGTLDAEALNPLLMVKDFNSTEFIVSDEFMTNADVPLLATKEIINSPVNPYTGCTMSDDYKSGDMLVSPGITIGFPIGSEYDDGGGGWYRVHDSIFAEGNWSRTDYE